MVIETMVIEATIEAITIEAAIEAITIEAAIEAITIEATIEVTIEVTIEDTETTIVLFIPSSETNSAEPVSSNKSQRLFRNSLSRPLKSSLLSYVIPRR
jgi:hypothetical protein